MKPKPKRLLCIDGGGVRGLLPIYYLLELEKDLIRSGKYLNIFEAFDFYAGTSIGSIITGAIVYTNSGSMQELVDKYFTINNFKQIFAKSYIDKVLGIFLNRPKYNGIFKKSLIQEAVGSQKLCDHNGKHILFTTYNADEQIAKFIKSYDSSEPDTLVADIINASSAAPGYFPPAEYTEAETVHIGIDGAIFANNPTDAAYADALELYGPNTDIRILSIGTGEYTYNKVGRESLKWGFLQWVTKGSLLDVIIGVNQDISDYKTSAFAKALGHKYIRIEESDVNIALDDITKLDELIALSHEWYLTTRDKVFKDIFDD